MVKAVVCQVLFRVALPLVLLLAVLFRYNVFSFVYLLLLLANPLVPGPNSRNTNIVRTNCYLKTVVGASTLFCMAQVVYQIVLLSTQSYSKEHNFADSCGLQERLLALAGLHRADGIKAPEALTLLGLDFVVLFAAVFTLVICEKLATPDDTPRSGGGGMHRRRHTFLMLLGEFLVLLLMAAAGILHASLCSLAYFVAFLWSATWLGMHRPLATGYRVMRTLLLLYSAMHFVTLYTYQLDYIQELVPPASLQARLLGLTSLRIPACNSTGPTEADIRVLQFRSLHWTLYVSPLVLLSFYFTVATVTRLQLLQQLSHESPSLVTTSGVVSHVPRQDSKRSSQRSAISFSRRHRKESGLLDNDHVGRSYQSMAVKASVEPSASVAWTSLEGTVGSGGVVPPTGGASVAAGCLAEDDTVAGSMPPDRGPGSRQLLLLMVLQGCRLLTRGSYVVTLIMMMAWSITYHSWLTFVLLLWSCVLWMMPSSRLACLRSSPALVAYAELLLLLQYLYSLDLTDEELPPRVNAVNLAQVGLFKYGNNSYQPLAVKMLYTIMFWITLRQYVEHQRTPPALGIELRRQMSMGTSSLGVGTQLYVRRLGHLVQQWLTRYWIWVVATMLMVISLGGTDVVLYRIAYMLLFLFFILVFQVSYQLWIKVMYGFWLTVIIYSMLVLILIYTYQFEKFPHYWQAYLHIPKEIQKDIGLEVYQSDPGTLFLKLLTPTFFLIITIIQLHYFHQEFIKLNEDNYRNHPNSNEDEPGATEGRPHPQVVPPTQTVDVTIPVEAPPSVVAPSPPRRHSDAENSDEVATPATVVPRAAKVSQSQPPEDAASPKKSKLRWASHRYSYYSLGNHLRYLRRRRDSAWMSLERIGSMLSKVAEVCWRLLEIHMMKVVLLAVFILAIYDVCAVHIIFVALVVVALPFRWMQLFLTHCCSMWASMLLLAKMIYQLNFVDRYGWATNCSSVTGFDGNATEFPAPFNSTIDNRIWIGFQKTTNLTSYCKGYIMLIVVFSAHAMVRYRQRFYRARHELPEPRPGVVFIQASRSNADDGIKQCLMYLLNYFFYKFGVEVCFVTMVTCIGMRLDVFALMTSLWLCAMFLLRRRNLAKVWPFYVAYLCFVLPLQYLVVVGLPPGLCIEYPWWDPSKKVLRETALWLFLPDYQDPPLARKILVDFVQLLFACCQLHVFFLESSHSNIAYEGGSNREIYDNTGRYIGQTPNPISDFVTYTRSYLSMVKVFLFFSFYWITLAVMFLAGTNRVSLFAMGYVLGCFFFLWNGNEFYLKPMNVLLKMWNTLLAYNVVVIFIKCILQVVGCVFLDYLSKYSCWMVQLFGIACLKRVQNEPLPGSSTALPSAAGGSCRVPLDEAGLLWDGICLAFLLMQKRLFTSYYFHHLIIEILAQQQLASRGAEMIHEIQMKDVQEQRAAERDIMEKIKRKMDKIRANQHKVRAGEYVEPETHFQAIRSGDYYLFDDFAGMDIDLDLDVKSRKATEEEDADVKVRGINALLSNAMKSGTIKCASEDARLVSEEADDVNESSRLSPIVSMDRSPLSRTVSGTSQPSKSSSRPLPSASDLPSTSADEAVLPEDPRHETHEGETAVFPLATATIAASTAAPTAAPAAAPTIALSSGPTTSKLSQPQEPSQVPGSEVPPLESAAQQPPVEDTYAERIRSLLAFGWALLDSMLISATAKLNSVSRDYRYVARKLADEKRIVKAQFVHGLATTLGEHTVKSRKFHFHEHSTESHHAKTVPDKKSSEEMLLSGSLEMVDGPDKQDGHKHHPSLVRFLIACYYAIVSRSEVVCYLVIVLNQMKSASLLSLPLPLMAFLWGSLSVPRPTKTFWITIITYTEAIVVVKYLFQFDFFDWNDSVPVNRPFDPPRILGIEKRKEDNDYALYDLLLLLLVFFHRFMLKSLGLWKDTDRSVSVSAIQQQEPASNEEQYFTAARRASEHSVAAPGFLASVPPDQLPGTSGTLELSALPVDTASSASRCYDDVIPGQSGLEESFVHLSKLFDGISRYVEPFRNFFENLLHPVYRVTTDVYAYMFFCDFINFFIMVFGYWAFGTGGSEDGVASYFQKNEVPVPFLIMLLAQFALIVIDRALYLRKYILGKLIFQVFIVFVIHIWMFFVLPGISQRSFVEEKNLPPKLWYFIKCIYLILSAYQIRSGYPTRILGNFFCKKYNYINYFLFKGYMLIPFLYELRSLMDWIWTDTSMNLTNWLKMEDIFANVFLLKCQRRAEEEYPTPRGSRRSSLTKYGLGGVMLFAIILVIWFPLLLFSLGNTVGQTLLPHDCTVELSLGGYEPIFKISAQQGNLRQLPYDSWVRLQAEYKSSAAAQAFLANYDAADVAVVTLNGNSTAIWTVSPPSQEALIAELHRSAVPLRLSWAFSRLVDNTNAEKVVGNERTVQLSDESVRQSLARMLNGNQTNVTVPPILPRFLLVPRKGKSDVIRALDTPGMGPYRNLTLRLRTGAFNNLSARSEWWEVQEHCTDSYPYPFLRDDQGSCTDLSLVVFNDKVFPQALSQLTGYGIAGLYTTFVLVVSRLIRGFMAGSSFTIMFDDMPNVDRVLQLCLDIYLVRESRELSLEEDLFAKLIFLYRSPETLIKWTRAADQQPLA
ncbi:piezo type mechanosensitive ion channel component isoform X2 [Dermacentor variabilis]|uniref:piezo type mechanosensitive ion channel component isoform X2 n=1 Tax=Dermacentor variabilis TaxID=34621 RepID=UPI003F5B0DCE